MSAFHLPPDRHARAREILLNEVAPLTRDSGYRKAALDIETMACSGVPDRLAESLSKMTSFFVAVIDPDDPQAWVLGIGDTTGALVDAFSPRRLGGAP